MGVAVGNGPTVIACSTFVLPFEGGHLKVKASSLFVLWLHISLVSFKWTYLWLYEHRNFQHPPTLTELQQQNCFQKNTFHWSIACIAEDQSGLWWQWYIAWLVVMHRMNLDIAIISICVQTVLNVRMLELQRMALTTIIMLTPLFSVTALGFAFIMLDMCAVMFSPTYLFSVAVWMPLYILFYSTVVNHWREVRHPRMRGKLCFVF